MNKRQTGTQKELVAAGYLKNKGYSILQMNYRCRMGEIDIIASHQDSIIFVEVKYRSSNRYGSSIEAVNYRKQNIIRRVASYYLTTVLKRVDVDCRFDVIGIDHEEITHLENAF